MHPHRLGHGRRDDDLFLGLDPELALGAVEGFVLG